MNCIKRITNMILFCVLFAAAFCLPPQTVRAGCDCGKDTANPPFLAAGADPNLLLMIDNSASMYDLAYTDTADDSTLCFDDTYDPDKTRIDPVTGNPVPLPYVGYYEKDTWYAYNSDPAADRFEITANGACAGGTVYSNANVCVATSESVDGEGNPITVVDAFRAKGNFLNWASASKFDIEKKILTGGKYIEANGVMESEGRGCTGNRFIKQVAVNSGGTSYQLVLGVRADYDRDDGVDTTLMDIFPLTTTGFVPAKCQEAIDLMMGDPTGFGGVKLAISDCMAYDELKPGEKDKQALTHSLHDCWYLDKHGDWPGGGPQGFNFESWCADVYTRIDPRALTPDDPAYVCAGDGTTADMDNKSFIGECWNPPGECHDVVCGERALVERERCNGGTGKIEYCTDWNSGKGQCKKESAWVTVVDCDGGAAVGGWKWAEKSDELDACIQAARERFCGFIETPQVIDPSDLQTTTGETWNLPAMLMDQGTVGQVGLPIATTRGIVEKDGAPAGILHEFSSQIRIGAMAFNHDGAGTDTEFAGLADYIYYERGIDGAQVIHPIGSDVETPGHTEGLVAAINNKHATSWTPLAEAMLTAVGYYTQDMDMEINPGADFSMFDAPITEWCQSNNVLFITDGASTADLNEKITAFSDDPDDGDAPGGFGDLFGSTYFDDLAYYGRHEEIFPPGNLGFDAMPKNINTFVVFTEQKEAGDDESDDETRPYVLMKEAVKNGGPNALNPESNDEVLLGQSPEDLSTALREAFISILKRAAAGSAASVISATRGGEGAVYQAIFWPGIDGPEYASGQKKPDVTWAGEVHALLVDAHGNLFEDTAPDKKLTDADQRVVFFFDENSDPVETKACYGDLGSGGVCSGTVKSLHEVKYLWSAAEWLSGIDDVDIDSNRNIYISGERKRYLFTWNDRNNDGVVDAGAGLNTAELISFAPATDWSSFSVDNATRGGVAYDFGVNPVDKTAEAIDAEVDALVSWVRGKDAVGYRSREVAKPTNFNIPASVENTITWRLGDVVHSTPTSVSRPAENYHLMYRDGTYIDFANQYENRRHVIYFGGNDGMIHAINGGFYNSASNGFCVTSGCTDSVNAPALGAELWAYLPYNLQPQLKCLADPDYLHRYYVDLKPRIFDVQIFTPDAVHTNGWGTIMVAGMRLGGSSVNADKVGDVRKFVSSYVIFDITDPEGPPVLLGELTYDINSGTHMGYTTLVPAVVPMKEGDITKWYLILGSGPLVLDGAGEWIYNTAIEGISNQPAKVAVFPLAELTSGGAFRIPDAVPTADAAGRYLLPDVGFVSDPISVDFDLAPNYRADAVYFGTVEGGWGNWSGKFYRMVTNADDLMTGPDVWTAPNVMLNPGRPITAAPMVGWDGDNFWVYFGTGRFFDKRDKSDASSNAQESYYGLKEPVGCLTGFTWDTLDKADLVPVGSILVTEAAKAEDSTLSCSEGGDACIPSGVTNFEELELYIAGDGCDGGDPPQPTGEAGWVLDFDLDRERNLGQATLLGGLLTFTTYQPFDDICRPEGEASLYAVYYKTGTAWHEAVFSDPWGSSGDPAQVVSKLSIGRGLATTPNLHVGREEGTKAFAQTSTGAIVEIEQPNLPIKAAKTGRMSWRVD